MLLILGQRAPLSFDSSVILVKLGFMSGPTSGVRVLSLDVGLKAMHLHRVNMQPLKAARQGGTARAGTERLPPRSSIQRCSKTSPEQERLFHSHATPML